MSYLIFRLLVLSSNPGMPTPEYNFLMLAVFFQIALVCDKTTLFMNKRDQKMVFTIEAPTHPQDILPWPKSNFKTLKLSYRKSFLYL